MGKTKNGSPEIFAGRSQHHLKRNALLIGLTFLATLSRGQDQPRPQEVTFQSGKLLLHGFLWKPNGPGPFPAVLWNHGSEKLPGSQPELGSFYTSHFFVFFIPHRRGQGRSPGEYIQDLVMQAPPPQRAQKMVDLQQAEVEDVVAAFNYLKAQPFVDPQRIAMSGCSYGGIQTLLAGERDLGIKALVPFAPGAMSWEQNQPLHGLLRSAVANAQAPMFLIQAKNDYDLSPSHVLSEEAAKKHKDFQSKIYPTFGSSHQEGHWKFCAAAMDIWGEDVLSFLAAHMKR
jgi:carboxymethylenebutenolidase